MSSLIYILVLQVGMWNALFSLKEYLRLALEAARSKTCNLWFELFTIELKVLSHISRRL